MITTTEMVSCDFCEKKLNTYYFNREAASIVIDKGQYYYTLEISRKLANQFPSEDDPGAHICIDCLISALIKQQDSQTQEPKEVAI